MFAYTALLLIFASLVSSQNVSIAIVRLQGTINNPGLDGVVAFYPEDNGNVTMVVNITGISLNTGANHGLHIHQFGDITLNNGDSVASHWNLYNKNHGCPENGGDRHIGDTGNWLVSAEGTLIGNKSIDLISVVGTNSIIGLGFILHNKTDDCALTTSSGIRLGQGIIGVANPAGFGTQNLAFPAATQNGANASAPTQAVCVLRPATPQFAGQAGVTGTIWFSQTSSGIAVSANITGLVGQYPRGIHIHQWGDIRLDNGMSAGPHYTGPYYNSSQPHNIPGSGFDHHVGDLGNIYYFGEDGTAHYYNVLDSFGLFGDLNSIIGRAVILHNLTDDCTGTNGNSGARIAQCVIGSANPAYGGSYAPLVNVPSAQNTTYCSNNPVPPPTVSSTSSGSTTSGSTTSSSLTGVSTTTSGASFLFASLALIIAVLLA